jgi:hypothetical protein
MVVSYSIASLNKLIAAQWSSADISHTVTIDQQNYDMFGDPYTTRWSLSLGLPALSFTADQKAVLTMDLSGEFGAVGTDSNGVPYRQRSIPPGYQLILRVPLLLLHGDVESGPISVSQHSLSFIYMYFLCII